MKRFNVHSTHGRASDDDGDVSVTAVYKMVNQPSTEHHGIKVNLKQDRARTVAHRRAPATATRTPR